MLEKNEQGQFKDTEKLELKIDYDWHATKTKTDWYKRMEELSSEEVKLYKEKNHDYAKGGDQFGNFKRVGKILGLYPGLDNSDPVVVSLVYMLKQLDCVLWAKSQKYEPSVESSGKRLGDISLYSKITRMMEEDKSE
jgi:hypothetical protein